MWRDKNIRKECLKELLGKFTVKKLFGWSDKQYNQEYWSRLERNWRQWKGKQLRKRKIMKTINEDEKINQENSGLRKWTGKDNNKMGNMVDPYYKFRKFLGRRKLKREVVS